MVEDHIAYLHTNTEDLLFYIFSNTPIAETNVLYFYTIINDYNLFLKFIIVNNIFIYINE